MQSSAVTSHNSTRLRTNGCKKASQYLDDTVSVDEKTVFADTHAGWVDCSDKPNIVTPLHRHAFSKVQNEQTRMVLGSQHNAGSSLCSEENADRFPQLHNRSSQPRLVRCGRVARWMKALIEWIDCYHPCKGVGGDKLDTYTIGLSVSSSYKMNLNWYIGQRDCKIVILT